MIEPKVVSVRMGQVAVATEGETLKSILGSCVGIGLFLKERNIFGLAHCLLPESPAAVESEDAARFVDRAVPHLLEQMGLMRGDYKNIEAIIIGGAHMLANKKYAPVKPNVGAQNVASAVKVLNKLGIKVVFENVGNDHGRHLFIDGRTGTFEVHEIGKFQPRRKYDAV